MEHRHFPRSMMDFEVILHRKTGEEIAARVLDISREGMRVRTNGGVIPAGTLINIKVPKDKRDLFGARYLSGFVTYATRDAIGLWLKMGPNS